VKPTEIQVKGQGSSPVGGSFDELDKIDDGRPGGGAIPIPSTKMIVTKDHIIIGKNATAEPIKKGEIVRPAGIEDDKRSLLQAYKVETAKDGKMTGTASQAGKIIKTARVVIEPEKKDSQGAFTVKHLDAFLLHANRKQVNLLTTEFPWVVKDGARLKANWRVGCWEKPDGGRIPFTVEEMVKYAVLIDKVSGKHAGLLKKRRAKKALRDSAYPNTWTEHAAGIKGQCKDCVNRGAKSCGNMTVDEIVNVLEGKANCPIYKKEG
jgi:hypothetical protein